MAQIKYFALFFVFFTAACSTTGDVFSTDDTPKVVRLEEQGDRFMAQGAHNNALTAYEDAFATDAGASNARLYYKAGNAAVALRKLQKGLAYYQRAANLAPENPEYLKAAARTNMMLGNYQQAIPFYERVYQLEATPQNYQALAVAFDMTGEPVKAQRMYRQALLQDPNNMNLRNNLGLSLLLQGETDKSLDILQSVAGSQQATPVHKANLALAYGLAGMENAAKRTLLMMNLSDVEAQRNIEIYRDMRRLSQNQLRSAVLLGDARGQNVLDDEHADLE